MKIIEKLSTYAALVGVIGAIGGGFYTWGQFNTRLDAIESAPAVDLSPLESKDKELSSKIDEALLYANEYKVDFIPDLNRKFDDALRAADPNYAIMKGKQETVAQKLRLREALGLN